ncbi:Mut7-C RNAse domain-containing protein [Streptomyces sp. NPDC059740]|uniref:Mut7-C RNAse domain-containing protein n=1 Tax=Streptomyces sp. NPDC059740 TaxID=3346926 RepID=UPI00365D5FA8
MLCGVSDQWIPCDIDPALHPLVSARLRRGPVRLTVDGTSTLGHLVESVGVPLTEVGVLLADGAPVPASHLPSPAEHVAVRAVSRPQQVPGAPLRFLLDVHLGTLARRLRLLGVDAAYDSVDAGDPALAARSAAERRVLLSRDRGLLQRREPWAGAYVYSHRPEEQVRDVLGRFRPQLRPWTRCTACNGTLREAGADEVHEALEGGTRRSYEVFARCTACGKVYWRGAHFARLDAMVREAVAEFGAVPPG